MTARNSALARRLKALERARRPDGSEPCYVCNRNVPGVTTVYRCPLPNEPDLDDVPDFCPGCGRRQVYWVPIINGSADFELKHSASRETEP